MDDKKIKAAEKLRQLLNENWDGGNVKMNYKDETPSASKSLLTVNENIKENRLHPHIVKENGFKEFLRLFRLVRFQNDSGRKEQ